MSWFSFAIFSIFALALAELTQQHLLNLKNGFTARASAVLTFAFQGVLVVPLLFLLGLENQIFSFFGTSVWQRIFLVTFLASIGMIFYLKSFRVKNISLSAVLISSSVIVSTILGIIFFSESIAIMKFCGIVSILLAIVIVNFKNPIFEKNHIFGLFAGLIFGVAYTIDKSILQHGIHPLIYIFWSFPLVAAWGFLFGFREVIGSVKKKNLIAYAPIAISGIGYLLYNFFTFSAYSVGGEVGRVDAINTAYIFIIIIFEYFFLKHKSGMTRKLLAATLAVLGIFILGNF